MVEEDLFGTLKRYIISRSVLLKFSVLNVMGPWAEGNFKLIVMAVDSLSPEDNGCLLAIISKATGNNGYITHLIGTRFSKT